MSNKRKNKGGRLRRIDETCLRKLEYAFIMGMNNRDACKHAHLAESTFYDYMRQNPKFTERKAALLAATQMRAKILISERLEQGCVKTAMWLLDRTDPEFMPPWRRRRYKGKE